MKLISILCCFLNLANYYSYGEAPKLFNPEILGATTEAPIIMFVDNAKQLVNPKLISLDITNLKYSGVTLFYPTNVSFPEAKAALNTIYRRFELDSFKGTKTLALWRNTEKRFAIQLSSDEHGIKMVYLPFAPTADVIKSLQDSNKQ